MRVVPDFISIHMDTVSPINGSALFEILGEAQDELEAYFKLQGCKIINITLETYVKSFLSVVTLQSSKSVRCFH
jgi:hypothetical protein